MPALEVLTWAGYVLAGFVAFLLVAHNPITPILRLLTLPVPGKWAICKCFLGAWLRSMLTLLPDLLAPVVVPVALLFTRWDAEKLPAFLHWWDNDASINGDVREATTWDLAVVPLEDTQAARGMCYWAAGHHPRSFYARWVWLGLRNRASALSVSLGAVDDGDVQTWSAGDANGPEKSGWVVSRVGGLYRYFETKRIGGVFLRMHYGYKVPRIPGLSKASFVAIAISFQRLKK